VRGNEPEYGLDMPFSRPPKLIFGFLVPEFVQITSVSANAVEWLLAANALPLLVGS
jgi:hypothetical protein